MHVVVNPRLTVASMLPRNGVGAEIGVFRGEFSKVIFRVASPKRLFLVDPWRNIDGADHAASWYAKDSRNDMEAIHRRVLATFAEAPYAARVQVVRSPSADWLREQPDSSLDFVYIDADHTYAAVRQDLDLSFAKVKQGGLICADDYALGHWWGDGVVRAVHDFLAGHAVQLACCLDNQVAIRKL